MTNHVPHGTGAENTYTMYSSYRIVMNTRKEILLGDGSGILMSRFPFSFFRTFGLSLVAVKRIADAKNEVEQVCEPLIVSEELCV